MLQLRVPGTEYYDERTNKLIITKDTVLQLEHSLVSISKWESTWKKSFLSHKEMTRDQLIDYVRCMTLNQNVSPLVYQSLTMEDVDRIRAYINDNKSATWSSKWNRKEGQAPGNQVITSEQIYGWMVALGIPFECQKWHLSRLLTLIRVCDMQQNPGKKSSKGDIARQQRAVNAARHRH